MVYMHTTSNLPSSPYIFHKVNILLLYCIMLSIPKSYIFFFVSHNCVICDCDMCYASVTICDLVTITCDIISHFFT